MRTSPASLGPLVGLYPFNAAKGHGSFVTFSLTMTPDFPTEDFYFWVSMCSWRIHDSGKQLAHSESSDGDITSAVSLLDGRKLEEVVLHTYVTSQGVLHGASLIFERRLNMRLYQYEGRSPEEEIFLLRDATGVWVSYLADGSLRTSQGAKADTADV